MAGNGTVDASLRTGAFSLSGTNGSSIIVYRGKETGSYLGNTLADAGLAKYNKAGDGSALNLSINLDNAGKLSPAAYIASQVGDRKYDNVIFVYHGEATGQADAGMQALFGPSSDIHSVLSSHTTGSGVVVYGNCFGIACSVSNQPQAMANLYGMNVLTASYGPIVVSVYDMTPTIPNSAKPGKYTTDGGYWNVATPEPKP